MKAYTCILFFLLISASSISNAQISGPSTAVVEDELEYTYSDGVIYSNIFWAVNGGTVAGSSLEGNIYKVTVHWTNAGLGKVTFLVDYQPKDVKDVTVTGCETPPTPETTLSHSNETCGPKTLSYSGTPPPGVLWYWQTAANGQETGYPVTRPATVSQTYWLRATKTCGTSWSPAVWITVAVNELPPVPNEYTMSPNTCGDKTISIIQPGGNIVWYWQGKDNPSGMLTDNMNDNYIASSSGTYYLRAYNTSTECWSATSAGISVTVTIPGPTYCDPAYLNWSETTAFSTNANGDPVAVASERTFIDGIGDALQSQGKNFAENQILANQPIKDRFGSPVITTLPAPINSTSFQYKYNFATNSNDQAYGANDFDKKPSGSNLPGEPNNPLPMANGGLGTLGWYYSSSNNLEPLTPVTSYPYTRTYIPEGPNPTISRSAGPGNEFKMGAGHEVTIEKLTFTKSELSHYFGLSHHFVTASIFENNLIPDPEAASVLNFAQNQDVTITTAANNGENYVSVTTNQGVSTPGTWPICGEIPVTPGATYRYKVKGYSSNGNAYLYIRSGLSGDNIGWPGAVLPTGPANEAWIETEFTVPSGVTTITVGVLFSSPVGNPVAAGQSFHINKLILEPQLDYLIGYKIITTTPDSKKAVSFTDIDGRNLATATLQGTAYDNWSYNYYNDIGQIIATVAPNGIAPGNGYPQFVTLYKYDHLGRLIQTNSTDDGTSNFVYSTDGKIRFSQDSEQALAGRFSYSNYDELGRLIETGEYIGGGTNPYVFQPSTIENPGAFSVLTIKDNIGFTGVSRKVTAQQSRCKDYSFIEYDKTVGLPAGYSAPTFTYGQVTKTENENSKTFYSYDEAGRVVWTLQDIVGFGRKMIEYEYDFLGNVIQVAYQKTSSTESFYHHFEYNQNQQLHKAFTSPDGISKTLQATYFYYLHGPLKRVELASDLQGTDYAYNIDGSLKMINHADETLDPGQDGFSGSHSGFMKDVFGEVLDYHANDYTGADYDAGSLSLPTYPDHFGGPIKAIRWHSPIGNHAQKAYAYSYDNVYQMSNAVWGSVTGSSGNYSFSPSPSDAYKESISGYDKNGNIQSLLRKGVTGNVLANFNYSYSANTNKLSQVTHNGGPLLNYEYDALGRMKRQTEGNKDRVFNYNAYGLVKEIRDYTTNRLIVTYLYDDRGNKLKKSLYDPGDVNNGLISEIIYSHDSNGNVVAIYENSGSPTEVPIYGLGRLALRKPLSEATYYEVNDHLGNVRGVISSIQQTEESLATLEDQYSESGKFLYYDEAVKIASDLFDHTKNGVTPPPPPPPPTGCGPPGCPPPNPEPCDPDDPVCDSDPYMNYSTRLIGGNTDEVYGLAKSLRVMPGDVINIEVYAKYLDVQSTNWTTALNDFITAIANGTAPPGTHIDGGAPGSIGNETLPFTPIDHSNETGSGPKAYLNWIVIDRNRSSVPVDFGFARLTDFGREYGQNGDHERLAFEGANQILITEPGYMYIYLSNENETPVEAFFDDFKVEHIKAKVVQADDYYPFGLTHDGDMVEEPYRYGYQGQFSEEDFTTDQKEFKLRNYDARIGRWSSPDPYGQFSSPYMAMGNVPHMSVDRDGGFSGCPPACPELIINAAGANAAMAAATNISTFTLSQLTITASRIVTSRVLPSLVTPLTTTALRQMAINAGVNSEMPHFNRIVGAAFEEVGLASFGLIKNTLPFKTPGRAFRGGLPTTIPDGVRDVRIFDTRTKSWTTYPNSSFFEAKAVSGTITLNYDNSQIFGILEAARNSPGGRAGVANVTFVTTANTVIGDDVIQYAFKHRISIHKSIAFRWGEGNNVVFSPTVKLTPGMTFSPPTPSIFGWPRSLNFRPR